MIAGLRDHLRLLQETSREKMRATAGVRVFTHEEPGCCESCGGPMYVQKTLSRGGRTIRHGHFRVHETVYVCAARCRRPSGALVTQKSNDLPQIIMPRRAIGYDVMVEIGLERFLHHRQREANRGALDMEYGVCLSTGETSNLAKLFLEYLEALHIKRAPALRAAMDSDGGWPLHVDATCETGRGTLLIAYAGWRRWVLGSWKIPTERTDVILPCLSLILALFGTPCAIVRDLGRAMIPAIERLLSQFRLQIPVLSCHTHFLADIGKDLLDPSHSKLRELFRHSSIRPSLRSLARELGRELGSDITKAREALKDWSNFETLLVGDHTGIAAVRALTQWTLDFSADSSNLGFPFDRPYLDLYNRCIKARRAIDAFLRKQHLHPKAHKALKRLGRRLDGITTEADFSRAAQILKTRAGLFDDLRAVLRLEPALLQGEPSEDTNVDKDPRGAASELYDIHQALDSFTASLQQGRPSRGPAENQREAIDIMAQHILRYGNSLWGHVIPLPEYAGGGIRLVDRTNNPPERFFKDMKKGERQRCGRKNLTQDFETLPAGAALAQNLLNDDYVKILCGSIDRLPEAFAELDAQKRRDRNIGITSPSFRLDAVIPEVASASLPTEDRRIVRAEAFEAAILAATRSRAPRGTL